MNDPVITVLDPGLGAAIHDQGRHGWRRFGVPPGGAMDDHAAGFANLLLGNMPWAPVVEILLHGARFEALRDVWIALTGADTMANVPLWRVHRMKMGDVLHLTHHVAGVWSYLAVEGGFAAERWLDSASVLPAAGLGRALRAGDQLCRAEGEPAFVMPPGVAARYAPAADQRDYTKPPPLRVFRGPQWEHFSAAARAQFFAQSWTVGPRSNRVGYRLEGVPLPAPPGPFISEPVLVGSLQVPDNGQLLAIGRDGPTVGGYPKIGLVHSADLSWLFQTVPGQPVRFRPADREP